MEALQLHQAQVTTALGKQQGPPDAATQIADAKSILARVRVTQLECVICKALAKSKNPLRRVDAFFAEFAQETGTDASTSICRHLAEHIAHMRSTQA